MKKCTISLYNLGTAVTHRCLQKIIPLKDPPANVSVDTLSPEQYIPAVSSFHLSAPQNLHALFIQLILMSLWLL